MQHFFRLPASIKRGLKQAFGSTIFTNVGYSHKNIFHNYFANEFKSVKMSSIKVCCNPNSMFKI